MHTVVEPEAVEVTARGSVLEPERRYAAVKVARTARAAGAPVLRASVVLVQEPDPARQRPATAEATLDVNGTRVRAHVTGQTMHEAADLLEERLSHRLRQLRDRLRTRHRWLGLPQEHSWRHGDLATRRPEYYPRPVEQREVIRRKSFAAEAETPDEAAYDMDLLSHDFFLFREVATNRDAVIFRREDDRYGLVWASPDTTTAPLPAEVLQTPGVVVEGSTLVLDGAEARRRLDLTGERFLPYADRATGRGRVLYRRYDGHYGLVSLRG